MIPVFELLFGPLAGSECRRLVGRRWLFVVRTLAALPGVVTVLIVGWIWWMTRLFEPDVSPYSIFTGGLIATEGIAVTVAFVLSPAVLAGTLAGEKASGTLELLLTARVSSGEIVLGHLLSRLGQVGIILLAGLPLLVWAAALCRCSPQGLLVVIGLPAAVTLGGGGIALAVSASTRRARDALLAVYLVELVLLIAPALLAYTWPLPVMAWLLPLNPYQGLGMLAREGFTGTALISMAWWTGLGLFGVCWATWRLRPSYLRQIGGTAARQSKRRRGVRPLGEHPMLWKELYADRTGTMGWVGRLLMWLMILFLLGTAVLFVVAIEWQRWVSPAYRWGADEIKTWFADVVLYTSTPISWGIQWVIGLRAAVAVASERERKTWDALLISPLEAGEIVLAKIAGSLHAVVGLVLAALVAWTVAVAYDDMTWKEYGALLSVLLVHGCFMAAVGVWFSLSSTSTTWAMTLTLVVWLGAAAALSLAAAILVLVMMLLGMLLWSAASMTGLVPWGSSPPVPMSFEVAWHIVRCALYLLVAGGFALHGRYRFDRLAGRAASDPARQAFVVSHRKTTTAQT